MKLLLVEDNAADARLIREMLKEAPPGAFQLEHAGRLDAARDRLRREPFDLVLLDLGLPDSQGMETLTLAQMAGGDLPIVVLTGRDDENFALEAVRAGAQDYLVKGRLSSELLVRTIRHAVERKRAAEELRRLNAELEQRVTERTAALSASESRYRGVVQNTTAIILRIAPEGIIRFANDRALQFFGYSAEELIGKPAIGTIVPQIETTGRNLAPLIADLFKNPDGFHYNANENMRKNGERVWVEWTNSGTYDENGCLLEVLSVGIDATERKKAEAALRAANESLELRVAERTAEVQQQAGQLRALAAELTQTEQRERKRLAEVLHDHIQQLLVAARMQVEWLQRDSRPERLQATAQGVDSILKEALDASRSLTVELSPPVLHTAGLVGALNWLAARTLARNQVEVILRAENKAEPPTEDSRLMLFECARELLLNAVKHSGVSQAHVTLLRTSDGQIKLIISDAGRGFDLDLLKKRRPDEASFGLFSIQQRLIHMGGQMEIATAPGKGTRVTLTLPAGEAPPRAQEPSAAARGQARPEELAVREKTALRRVLVVDDHKIMREGLVSLMQFESDIEVVGQAADGPAAIELAARLQPDAVIMDVNLGDGMMNGVEATKRILAGNANTKVIGLSMHAGSDIATALRDAGAVAFLTKGGPSEDLLAAIRTACR